MKNDKVNIQKIKYNGLIISITIWFVLTVLFGVMEFDITAKLWIISDIVKLFISFVGIILFIISLMQLVKYKTIKTIIIFQVVIVIGILHLNIIPWFGISEQIKLSFMLPKYKSVISTISNGTNLGIIEKNGVSEIDGIQFIKGSGEQVAFPWFSGVTDNWIGIVYDPTDSVDNANKFKSDWSNWNDPNLEEVKKMFGGDLEKSILIEENWYKCIFT